MLCITVSSAFRQALDGLASDERLSREELVRRAVALYAFAQQQSTAGRRLGFFEEADGKPQIKRVIAL